MIILALLSILSILAILRILHAVFMKIVYSTKIQFLGKFFYRVKTNEKFIALTYDDGPNPPNTDRLLDVLAQYQVKATFFVLGKQVELYPEVIQRTISLGHELGNHSYSHPKMVWKKPAFIHSEIVKTDRLLRELGVKGEIHFRPPFGMKFLILPYILTRLKKTSILWNLDSTDYKLAESTAIVDNIMKQIVPGSIVLLHDALDDRKGDRSATILATRMLIEELKSQGYKFKTISELLAHEQHFTKQ
jgi:peptidoglycan-N-acetylglucosamine deacetylase